jgi:hypothetical protein
MAALWRTSLVIEDPPLDEGGGRQRNLQVLNSLLFFQDEIAVKRGVTVVMNS